MTSARFFSRSLAAIVVTLLFAPSVYAYSSNTWDFRTGSNGSPSTNTGYQYGNVRTFTENSNGWDETITATVWADTGLPNPPGTLEDAYLGRYSTGLGSCNRGEGSISYCDGNNPLHQFDNAFQNDLVLFSMDQGRYQFNEVVIDPYGVHDRDVSFWVGSLSDLPSGGDLTGIAIDELVSVYGFTKYDDKNPRGSGPLTIDLLDVEGNTLIFGSIFPPNKKVDRFKIRSLTATLVPVPAAVWLMGSGLLALFGMSRRKA